MRLILSRKGFDSESGGFPSPILPDGRMVSLPIPDCGARARYGELHPRRLPMSDLVRDLTNGRCGPRTRAHLDPDLERTSVRRRPGWRPAFGQTGPAASHLDRHGVGAGDLFLFFGLFRPVERCEGRWRYVRGAAAEHILFGWLRVGRMISSPEEHVPGWLEDHPHALERGWPGSRIYVAARPIDGGVFSRHDPRLRLTAPGASSSVWQLPAAFMPRGRPPLSYHGDSARWSRRGAVCHLRTVARGQEFVLDCDKYPAVRRWAEGLVGRAA